MLNVDKTKFYNTTIRCFLFFSETLKLKVLKLKPLLLSFYGVIKTMKKKKIVIEIVHMYKISIGTYMGKIV